MMFRRFAACVCAVAGVYVLAGVGWSLLAASVLLVAVPVPARLVVLAGRCEAAAKAGWQWLLSGRRSVAVASMPLAVIMLPLGIGLIAGVGAAVVAGGVALGAVSLLTGQNT